MGHAFWVGSCLCQNPEVQGVASLEAAPVPQLRHRSLGECAEVEATIQRTRKFVPYLPSVSSNKTSLLWKGPAENHHCKTDALT